MERSTDSGLESGTVTWGQDVVLLCQRIPKQDVIRSGCREGVAGHLPLEWVATYEIGAQGKAFVRTVSLTSNCLR
jgi:hypothetical protein